MTRLVAKIPDTWLANTGGVVTQLLGAWTVVNTVIGVPIAAYYLDEIDLAGLTIQEQTFFPMSAMIQGNQQFAASGYVAGDVAVDVTVVSTVPLTDDAILNCVLGSLPGMTTAIAIPVLGTTDAGMDLENIVFGQTRSWVYDTQTDPYLRLNSSDNFGTNTGIASSRLFCYRIISVPTTDTGQLQSYPTAIVVNGATGEEEDLVRLMRMKQNTRLQQ